ncbi:MAG TPA: glycoside hydrolase family 31 protein [Bacteroidota bacterium]|nr:glycoside hydrolase family 31 protein [Bacteroidota bacterium]
MKKSNRFVNIASCILSLAIIVTSWSVAQWIPLNPVTSVERQGNGLLFTLNSGAMKLEVCSGRIVHLVQCPTSTFPQHVEYLVTKSDWSKVPWTFHTQNDTTVVETPDLIVTVAHSTCTVNYATKERKPLFTDDMRTLTPVVVNGEKTWHTEMFSNLWGSGEAFYGLGGHQAGVWNYRGEAVDLSQDNTNISIPFFVSSNGYGIFWNNTSRSRFNNRFLNALYLSSEVADAVDYYFIYGPEPDSIVAGYRTMTGAPPLFPKWSYGYWQCKNRYSSQEELLGVAHKYRELHIPVDGIVQDWFWWKTMGEPAFDLTHYPDAAAMVEDLHKNNFHLMISFWPYFRPGSKTYDEMDRLHYFIDKTKVAGFHPAGQALYDAFNPGARNYYWHLLDTALFRIGVDAWWLDTIEPETEGSETNVLVKNQTALGSGARFANMYPLMTETGVYEGQRRTSDKKRVFILGRCAYAGSQRTATTVWSGDVNSDWVFFKKQIPSGLNYSISGLPYWTTDIGGFLIGNPDDPGYRELFVRWFQFGTFCPILRVHGTRTTNQNELWSYGASAESTLVRFDRLRYRLMPYIYSLAWMATSEGYTIMRPLVMDYRTDVKAANVGDQFMFGPAFLINPVTEPGADVRRMYLPGGAWYDFWKGTTSEGAKFFDADAPIDRMPIFVRAGSIVPMGPDVEWVDQKPADPLEIRVYIGANGKFLLYEDEGNSYDYEKGVYSTIPLAWDEATKTLTIGDRKGGFPGMLASRTFRIIFVKEGHGAGIEAATTADKEIVYEGKQVTVAE